MFFKFGWLKMTKWFWRRGHSRFVDFCYVLLVLLPIIVFSLALFSVINIIALNLTFLLSSFGEGYVHSFVHFSKFGFWSRGSGEWVKNAKSLQWRATGKIRSENTCSISVLSLEVKCYLQLDPFLDRISIAWYLNNGFFYFRKMKSHNCNSVCIQIELHALKRYENLFAHTVAVMRLHLSKNNNPFLIFIF